MSWRDDLEVRRWSAATDAHRAMEAAVAARDRELRETVQAWYDDAYPDEWGKPMRAAFKMVLLLLDRLSQRSVV